MDDNEYKRIISNISNTLSINNDGAPYRSFRKLYKILITILILRIYSKGTNEQTLSIRLGSHFGILGVMI